MSPPLFWIDEVPSPGIEAVLTGHEGRHAVTVTRIGVGERILLGDGKGGIADCEVVSVDSKDTLRARVHTFTFTELPNPTVTVVQALPKAERSELAVDLATEAGVDRIVPWQAARCVSRWKGKADKGIGKWEQAATSAAKQSRRPWIPEIAPLVTTTDVRAMCSDIASRGGVAAVLHESGARPFRELPLAHAPEVLLIVGPEGGLDDTEITDFAALGAHTVVLGPQVLRTSAAAAVALGAIGVLTERWSR